MVENEHRIYSRKLGVAGKVSTTQTELKICEFKDNFTESQCGDGWRRCENSTDETKFPSHQSKSKKNVYIVLTGNCCHFFFFIFFVSML